jgi:hypothetical protein
MGFLTPEEIAVKAKHAYLRFLTQWVSGADGKFFPHRVRARFSVDSKNPRGTIGASEALLGKSKAVRGWGYTVHREQVRMRDFGNNPVPRAITIDSLDDLLRLANRKAEFEATALVVEEIRASLPALSGWLETNVRSLHQLADSVTGVIQVAQYFISHPWPDCYSRQIPVPVDTKFIRRHRATLRQWLDLLLPPSEIDVNEATFARRFGLRDGQEHRAVRVLDQRLMLELGLPFDELSLPLRSMAALPVKNATVVIVENDLNLLTLPTITRGLGIRGEGNSVNRLEQLRWLDANRLLYWGDIDVEGFVILSRLRNLFPRVESVLMDMDTIRQHERLLIDGAGSAAAPPTNLTATEADAFDFCVQGNRRLEQERILQPYVDQVLTELILRQDVDWRAPSSRLTTTDK